MADDYRIETLTPDHFPDLIPLMVDVFGGDPPAALFNWKYLQNPAGPAIGQVARAPGGEVAAFYGMIPEIYRWGETDHRLYQSCDTMTHSRHRRRGLFQLLAKKTYASAQEADPGFFAIGFSGPMSTPGFIKMGWANPFAIPHRFKPRLLARVHPLPGKGPTVSTTLPATLPALMARADAGRRHSLRHSEQFVAWRFANPTIEYRYLVDDGAYAVFKQTRGFVYLLEFWEQDPDAGKAVMRALMRSADQPGSRGLLTACQTGGTLDRALQRYLFLRNPLNKGPASERTPFITYGALPVPAAGTPGGWDITAVDFDSL